MRLFKPKKTPQSRPETVRTEVPGGEPIELVVSYEEFAQYYPTCELQTKRWFVENVESDWVCLDIGANVGYHSILLARLASEGLVFAFEPTSTFEMLQQNIDHAGVGNVTPVKRAISSRKWFGSDEIYRIWGSRPERIETEFDTIDSFVSEMGLHRVDLIKIDIDGFDLDALWGSQETLRRFSPVVVVELNHALATRGQTPSHALSWMLEQGYSSALVLDDDNYLFTKGAVCRSDPTRELRIRFEDRDPWTLLEPSTEETVCAESQFEVTLHNGSSELKPGRYFASAPPWNYVVSTTLPSSLERRGIIVIQLTVHRGDLGVSVTDSSGSWLLTTERLLSEGGEREIRLEAPRIAESLLVFRKTTGRDLEFSINKIELRRLGDGAKH